MYTRKLRNTSAPGQTEKNSVRAYVFRVGPHSEHWVGHVARCSVARCKGRTLLAQGFEIVRFKQRSPNDRFAPEAAGRESCSGRTRLLTRCRSFARDIATRGTRWRRISHAARVKSNLASIHSRTVGLHVEGGTEAVGPVQKACEAALLCTRSPSWTTRITSILTPLQFCENGRHLRASALD